MQQSALSACAGMHAQPTPRLLVWLVRPHMVPASVPLCCPAGFGNFRLTKHANAYMLVYVRESEWGTVMCDVTEQDISDHVRARLKVGPAQPAPGAELLGASMAERRAMLEYSGEQGCPCGV